MLLTSHTCLVVNSIWTELVLNMQHGIKWKSSLLKKGKVEHFLFLHSEEETSIATYGMYTIYTSCALNVSIIDQWIVSNCNMNSILRYKLFLSSPIRYSIPQLYVFLAFALMQFMSTFHDLIQNIQKFCLTATPKVLRYVCSDWVGWNLMYTACC